MKESEYSVFYFKNTHYIVNTVNTMGVMGKGLALEFSIRFTNYANFYKDNFTKLKKGGDLQYFHEDKIISFATKENWKNKSQILWIIDGLYNLKRDIQEMDIKKIALPLLGCQNGGLKTEDVVPIIKNILSDVESEIIICHANKDTPKDEEKINKIKSLIQLEPNSQILKKIFNKNVLVLLKEKEVLNNIKLMRDFIKVKGIGKNQYKKIINFKLPKTKQDTLL